MTRIRKLLVITAALGGCSLQPDHVRPEAPVPGSWPQGDAYLAASEQALPSIDFQQVFGDPRVQSLIDAALQNNRNLREAAANIASMRAQYRIQRAERLPTIEAGAGAVIGRGRNQAAMNRAGTGIADNTLGGGSDGARTFWTAEIGATAFEIDLFGRVKSLSDAALEQYFATAAAARATRLALVGDIATVWLTYGADRSLLTIAQETVENAGRNVDLTRARLQGGVAPRTDLRQAETIHDQARADLAQQKTALAQDINLLRLLLGAEVDRALLPESIDDATAKLGGVPAGLDSQVLLRRPDVVQAEYQLRSMNARIGAARAALFPRISLTSLAGLATGSLTALFAGDGFSWQVRPMLTYPIFQAGALQAGVAQSRAARDAALARYELTIQTAFRETADALARRGTVEDQLDATRDLTRAADDNYKLSYARYRGGIDNFLQSLDAQRSLYSARRTLVQVKLTRATNLARLYQALGGDSTLDAVAHGPEFSVNVE